MTENHFSLMVAYRVYGLKKKAKDNSDFNNIPAVYLRSQVEPLCTQLTLCGELKITEEQQKLTECGTSSSCGPCLPSGCGLVGEGWTGVLDWVTPTHTTWSSHTVHTLLIYKKIIHDCTHVQVIIIIYSYQQPGGHVVCGSTWEAWPLWVSLCDEVAVVVHFHHQSTPMTAHKMELSSWDWNDRHVPL